MQLLPGYSAKAVCPMTLLICRAHRKNISREVNCDEEDKASKETLDEVLSASFNFGVFHFSMSLRTSGDQAVFPESSLSGLLGSRGSG